MSVRVLLQAVAWVVDWSLTLIAVLVGALLMGGAVGALACLSAVPVFGWTVLLVGAVIGVAFMLFGGAETLLVAFAPRMRRIRVCETVARSVRR